MIQWQIFHGIVMKMTLESLESQCDLQWQNVLYQSEDCSDEQKSFF